MILHSYRYRSSNLKIRGLCFNFLIDSLLDSLISPKCFAFTSMVAMFCITSTGNAQSDMHVAVRMETTNVTESAPLNLINRAFGRIEDLLIESIDSQRLTYRANDLAGQTIDQSILKQLIRDVAGDSVEVTVQTVEKQTTETQLRIALATLISTNEMQSETSNESPGLHTDLIERFGNAAKAALSRDDVKLYSARSIDKAETSKILLFVDEETSDILALYVTKAVGQ